MEFYQAIENRRTTREFTDREVSQEVLNRILKAGLLAPTHNHLRDWEFVVLQESGDKDNALQYVRKWAKAQDENRSVSANGNPEQKMYAYAMPRQYDMLFGAPYVVLPFFKAGEGLLRPVSLSALNSFASVWCCIENIFLAAAAEGLSCSMRIPVGDEGKMVARAVGAPSGYRMPCYIGMGYPAEDAPVLEQIEYTAAQKIHFGKW